MKAIVLSALVGVGVLCAGSSQAEACWLKKIARGCRVRQCQPVPAPACLPPVQAPCVSGAYQGAYTEYDGVEKRPACTYVPPVISQRPCGETSASFRLEVQVQSGFAPPCTPVPPPCPPVRFYRPCR
jgi:hypothetical protein